VKKDDILSGCILIAVSIFFLRESSFLPPSSLGIPGSAFFPRLMSIAFLIFGSVLIIRSFKKGGAERKTDLISKQDLIRVGAVILLCGICIFSIPFLGFIFTTILFIGFLMLMFQVKRIEIIILWSFFITLIVYFIFKILLKVPLPIGTFFS